MTKNTGHSYCEQQLNSDLNCVLCQQLKMKITDFENRRSFKSIWLNSQFREEVRKRSKDPLHVCSLLMTQVLFACARRSPSILTSMAVSGTFWKNVKRQWSSLKKALRSSGTHPAGECVFVCWHPVSTTGEPM